MVHNKNNFFFLKNIKFSSLNLVFFDNLENNFIFFKKFKENKIINFRFFKIQKINSNKTCINIFYF